MRHVFHHPDIAPLEVVCVFTGTEPHGNLLGPALGTQLGRWRKIGCFRLDEKDLQGLVWFEVFQAFTQLFFAENGCCDFTFDFPANLWIQASFSVQQLKIAWKCFGFKALNISKDIQNSKMGQGGGRLGL